MNHFCYHKDVTPVLKMSVAVTVGVTLLSINDCMMTEWRAMAFQYFFSVCVYISSLGVAAITCIRHTVLCGLFSKAVCCENMTFLLTADQIQTHKRLCVCVCCCFGVDCCCFFGGVVVLFYFSKVSKANECSVCSDTGFCSYNFSQNIEPKDVNV